MARWYRIIVGSQTFDATGDPNALQVELDIAVGPYAVPNVGQGAWCRVWGIPLQTVLTANQFTNHRSKFMAGWGFRSPIQIKKGCSSKG